MTRILRCDGLVPTTIDEGGARQSTPDELADMLNWLDQHALLDIGGASGGRRPGFDVVVEGESDPGDAAAARQYEEAGATWWLEARWTASDPSEIRTRIASGP